MWERAGGEGTAAYVVRLSREVESQMPSVDEARRYRAGSSPNRRRALRLNETDAEHTLWLLLRSRRLAEYKFRRQHSVGPYVADFYCFAARLVVEVDGAQHYTADGVADDHVRTRYLEAAGLRVLRFTNVDVLTQREAVLQALLIALER